MHGFVSMAWAVQVWTVAAMTLLAGIPWTDCVCPDGTRKVFCSGRQAPDSGCCGAACPSQSSEAKSGCAAKQSPCCLHNTGQTKPTKESESSPRTSRQTPSPKPDSHGQVAAKGCSRVLTDSQTAVVTAAEQSGGDSYVCAAAALGTSCMQITSRPGSALYFVARQGYAQPPPTDLVISLQRLVI